MNLTRVTDKHATDNAINKIEGIFRKQGIWIDKHAGHPGGRTTKPGLWGIEDAGLWFVRESESNRHWCAFGTLPTPKSGNASITVEINPPKQGINRRVAGVLAVDDAKKIYLCHTGKVGGSKKGIGKLSFLEWNGEERVAIVDPDGGSTDAFLVAEVGNHRMVYQIAEYVWAVAAFKEGKPPRIKYLTATPFGGSDKEHEGKKYIPARAAKTAACDHAIVRNRLADLIREAGRDARRDRHRDLIVGKSSAPDFEFEIKANGDLYSIYTAVGQLMIHNVAHPAKRRVVVLPSPISAKIHRALASIKIDVATYRWTKTKICFSGMEELIRGIGNRAPIKGLR